MLWTALADIVNAGLGQRPTTRRKITSWQRPRPRVYMDGLYLLHASYGVLT